MPGPDGVRPTSVGHRDHLNSKRREKWCLFALALPHDESRYLFGCDTFPITWSKVSSSPTKLAWIIEQLYMFNGTVRQQTV